MKFKVGDRVLLDSNRKLWNYIHPSIVGDLQGHDKKRVWVIREDVLPGDKYPYGLICEETRERCRWRFDDEELVSAEEPQAQAQTDESVIADLTKRVQGLLEANNALVEREREAKRRAEAAERAFITARDELFATNGRLMALEETASKLREQAGEAIILRDSLKDAKMQMKHMGKELEDLKSFAVVPPSHGKVVWISESGNPFIYMQGGWIPVQFGIGQLNISPIGSL